MDGVQPKETNSSGPQQGQQLIRGSSSEDMDISHTATGFNKAAHSTADFACVPAPPVQHRNNTALHQQLNIDWLP